MISNKASKVILVDDHSAIRAGYKLLLENDPGLEVVAEFSSGEEANQHIPGHDPDIVIMDLSMPGMGGIEAIRRLKIKCPDVKILVFTMHENTTFLGHAMKAGANGYITKSGAPNMLNEAVHTILSGGTFIDPAFKGSEAGDKLTDGQLAVLSRREFQIFCKFAEGLNTSEIADELSLSVKTVANYQTQIKDKLNLHTSAEWVKLAINHGIIQV